MSRYIGIHVLLLLCDHVIYAQAGLVKDASQPSKNGGRRLEARRRSHNLISIPAPSGPHAVGCVDLMRKFPGEEDGLLVRLFYPSEGGAGYKYTKCVPNKRYTEATLGIFSNMFPPLLNLLENARQKEPGLPLYA